MIGTKAWLRRLSIAAVGSRIESGFNKLIFLFHCGTHLIYGFICAFQKEVVIILYAYSDMNGGEVARSSSMALTDAAGVKNVRKRSLVGI